MSKYTVLERVPVITAGDLLRAIDHLDRRELAYVLTEKDEYIVEVQLVESRLSDNSKVTDIRLVTERKH